MPEQQDMSGRVKEVAVEEAERIKVYSTQAIKSRAYLYPVKVSESMLFQRLPHMGVLTRCLPDPVSLT